jgi:sarcosine oxidase gamma subunit
MVPLRVADAVSVVPSIYNPIFVELGETIAVSVSEKTKLVLQNSTGEFPLETTWVKGETSVSGEFSTIGFSPGKYNLLRERESSTAQFLTAIHISEAPKQEYRIALARNVLDLNQLTKMLSRWEASGLDWVAVSGPVLNEDFTNLIKASSLPIVGLLDVTEDTLVSFGPDAWFFLGRDTNSHKLVKMRSAQLASRWSIAVALQRKVNVSQRSQMVLFVDMPVDYWVAKKAGSRNVHFGKIPRIEWPLDSDEIRLVVTELSIETIKK